MPNWRFKAALQLTMSVLPRSAALNRVFQRRVTKSLAVTPDRLAKKWGATRRHVEDWRASCGGEGPFTVLEVGTGWHPIAPLALVAAGASSATTVDRTSLLDPDSTRAVLLAVADGVESGRLAADVPEVADRFRIAAMSSAPDAVAMLAAAGVRCEVGDLQGLALPTGSVDLSITNNTLEHIPPEQLAELLAELARIAGPTGASAHFIDLADHYSQFDRRITAYNFLAYTDRWWRLYNNDLHFQNRLRASDYRELLRTAGLAIVAESCERGEPSELPAALAPRFRRYRTDDLLVHSMWVVCRPVQPVEASALR